MKGWERWGKGKYKMGERRKRGSKWEELTGLKGNSTLRKEEGEAGGKGEKKKEERIQERRNEQRREFDKGGWQRGKGR